MKRLTTPAIRVLASALLFGASVPAAKVLLGHTTPQLAAGIFYLGSGLGLAALRFFMKKPGVSTLTPDLLLTPGWFKSFDILWMSLATIFGGIIGPLLLMIGLTATTAASSSLLLNLEGVFTALLAWVVFKEHTDRTIVVGMFAIILGGAVLTWVPSQQFAFSTGPLLVAAACLCWAVDNNFTRNVSEVDPTVIAMFKGLIAGSVNCLIALKLGTNLPPPPVILAAGTIGFLSYGVSLTLYIMSLRRLGTARAGAYFSTAPFAGALLSVLVLHEPATLNLLLAGILMGVGIILHLSETHEHEHIHPAQEHEHMHTHDEQHQHGHGPDVPPGEPHTHIHKHGEIRHFHPHYPDQEHRHKH